MSLIRSHRIALALCLLVAQTAALAHLAIADHTLTQTGEVVEACDAPAAAPVGISAIGRGAAGSEERCLVFEATLVPVEVVQPPASVEVESTRSVPVGEARSAFVRCALVDAPKASPPSRA